MTLCLETITFLKFVAMGMLFSVIFDVFRAIRRLKKPSAKIIQLQDIVYFIIIGIIMLIAIINIIDTEFRFYLIFAIILGVIIYISVFGNLIRNIFVNIFKLNGKILEFLMLPVIMYLKVFDKQINILKKFVGKCCKKISYMINFKYVKSNFVMLKKKLKTKEDCKNDKNRKPSC